MREPVKETLDKNLLNLYRSAFYSVLFPVKPEMILEKLTNCRCMTYQEIAAAGNRTVRDVIRACSSADGCTHYDPVRRRYLVAVNAEGRSNGRIRWTTAHELGHILAGHFIELAEAGRPEATPSELSYMEEEADSFAATFLAPFQAIEILQARTAADIRDWFELSQTAAEHRWAEFKNRHGETELDRFLKWSGAHSSAKKPRAPKKYRPIDVWADELL